jgi:predicted MFS family arabinose efflux permease
MAFLQPGLLGWIGAAFGLAHGLFYPAFNAMALEGAAPHERGKFMALFNSAFNAGWAGGGLGLGVLAEAAGYPPVFIVSAAIVFAGLALFIASPEVRRGLGRTQSDDASSARSFS